ncbi:MAG: phosphate signaling complex protein PhoU [Firmicutes bacterium]|nr:phosphate signaling complex protein PhoU [Bacillota bacterium]
MRNKFDEQLETLNVEMIKMGSLCEEAITTAVSALSETGESIIEKAASIEFEIDEQERKIETLCMKLILQQQPVAHDLRVISSALKMISDMERIGDQALDIAEITKFVTGVSNNGKSDLQSMAKETSKMVTDSIDSFVRSDLALAQKVISYDDIIDKWFNKIKQELIGLIAEDNTQGEYYIDLMMVAKYLERIGDHATNIAEWVEYSITGVHQSQN